MVLQFIRAVAGPVLGEFPAKDVHDDYDTNALVAVLASFADQVVLGLG